MAKDCLIKFEFEEYYLNIYAFNLETKLSKTISRDKDCIEKIEKISAMYRALVAFISFAEEDDQRITIFAEDLGEQLYALFFEGLEDILEGCSNLLIEHSMFRLPLELAFNGTEFIGQKYSVGNWVKKFGAGKEREILKGSWIKRLERKPRKETLANFKVLFFGDIGNESEALNKFFSWNAKDALCETLTSTWSDSLLEKLNTNDYTVLHMTCHGSYNETDPEQSFLILDRERAGKTESAILKNSQLKNVNLSHTPLVFLNACHSGRIEKNYLGFVGFADSLLKSGVANFITTLWSISDRSALYFAGSFYNYLLAGEPVGEALRKARCKSFQDNQDILTGMSYVLFGDPRTRIRKGSESKEADLNSPEFLPLQKPFNDEDFDI